MKKGVIFTMDAVVALAIFVGSLVFFARFFTDTTFTGLSDINIYSQSDNFLETVKAQNWHTEIYWRYVNGSSNEEILNALVDSGSYPMNIKFYFLNGSDLQQIASIANYTFDQKIILRKILIYQNTTSYYTDSNATIAIESGLPGSILHANVTLSNPGPTNWTDIVVTGHANPPFTVTSPDYALASLNVGESLTQEFNITAPANTTVDTYPFWVNVSYYDGSDTQNEAAIHTFSIIGFGMAEMEVGMG